MKKYILCPCCGNQMRFLCEDGNLTVFFNEQNQDELKEKLSEIGIELGITKGGEISE